MNMKRMMMMLAMSLGMLVDATELCPSFTGEAVREYRQRAEEEDAEAQYLYSIALANGFGIEKNQTLAMKYLMMASKQGFGAAYWKVACAYEIGMGVESNAEKAVEWHLKHFEWARSSVNNGNDVYAQFGLGKCYSFGKGIDKDEIKAAKWYRKAAEQGYAPAQCELGMCYIYGNGVDQDDGEAAKWYRRAAEQGYVIAQRNLGVCYANGNGVVKDLTEAVRWYRMAAEQGCALAQCNIGVCYAIGNGVDKDMSEAIKWFRKSAEQGCVIAQRNLIRCNADSPGVGKSKTKLNSMSAKMLDAGLNGGDVPVVLVSNVTFRQRYPWNGLVDIDSTIMCSDPLTNISLHVNAMEVGTKKPLNVQRIWLENDTTHNNTIEVQSGSHRLVWDAGADNPNVVVDAVVEVQAKICSQEEAFDYPLCASGDSLNLVVPVAPVPEPNSVLLLLFGCGILALRRKTIANG